MNNWSYRIKKSEFLFSSELLNGLSKRGRGQRTGGNNDVVPLIEWNMTDFFPADRYERV